jgi:hypothetical protein
MRFCNCLLLAVVLGLFVLFVTPFTASAQCVSGTISSELQLSGPYAGLYKYTIEITWDSPQGLSNITLDCGYDCAPTLACQQQHEFDNPAGYSDGEPAVCQVDYVGEFNCNGNPSIGITYPIVKWNAVYSGGCEPGATGSGTFWFYTIIAPTPDSPLPIIIEKNGQNVCDGIVLGDCPTLCTVPVEDASWGEVKSHYLNTE